MRRPGKTEGTRLSGSKVFLGAIGIIIVLTAAVAGIWLLIQSQEDSRKSFSVIVASRIIISSDFSSCLIRFANYGNSTDTTRSVLLFYAGARSQETIVRNADPPPSMTILPGETADWDCASSFAGSPPGIKGEAVHVVISAVISRERDSVGYFA